MGLWDILTKEIKLGSHELGWSEPMLYRTRLRNDLIWRVVICLSAWLAATGIMLLIFAFNQNPPSRGVAFGLALVFGLGPAVMALFFRKSQVSGNIKLFDDRMERHRMSSGYIWRWMETATWGLNGITKFHVVTSDKTGKSFHVMFFKSGSEWELIGIPTSIELKKLRAALSAGGAEVTVANRVPDTFRTPLSPAVAGVSGVVGIALAATGFVIFNPGNAPNRPQRPNIAQNHPNFPRPDLGNPGPINPGLPGGNPPGPNEDNGIPGEAPGFPGGFSPPQPPANFGGQVPQPNNARPGDPSVSVSGDEFVGSRSKLVGGMGGAAFTKVSADQQPVLGIRYRMGNWAGQERLGAIDPLFEPIQPAPAEHVIQAKPGYALGAVEINASDFVDGVRLIFMKQTGDGHLDPGDSYPSEWIGTSSAGAVRLERNDTPIIGFHGRAVAIVDALGVVFRE